MTQATLLAFTLVAFVAIVTPGPTTLLALANGSRFGARRALAGMAGAVLSDFVLVAAAAAGLGALLAASEFWFSVVKWAGVGYLVFLGIALLRSKGSPDASLRVAETGQGTARALFLKCFLVAVTNPKGYLFVSAFLPQFIDAGAPQAGQYLTLAIAFASVDLAVMAGYAILGSRAARVLRRRGAIWLDRVCGGVFLALAGSLALYRRSA